MAEGQIFWLSTRPLLLSHRGFVLMDDLSKEPQILLILSKNESTNQRAHSRRAKQD